MTSATYKQHTITSTANGFCVDGVAYNTLVAATEAIDNLPRVSRFFKRKRLK